MPSLQRRFKPYTDEEKHEYVRRKYAHLQPAAKAKRLNESCVEVGKKIKKLRLNAGMSQRELGMRLKTYQCSISRIEKGSENFKIESLERIAKEFNKKIKIILY